MKRPIIIIFLICIVISALLVVQITLSDQIAVTGAKLLAIQDQTDLLKNQNLILQQQVLSDSSLSTIANEAKKLGFVADTTPVYLTTPLPLALNQ